MPRQAKMESEPMVQRNFGLRYTQFIRLKQLSVDMETEMAEIVRHALDDYFKKHGVKRSA